MIKLQNTTDDFSFEKYFSATNIIVAVTILLTLYILGLLNPLTGPGLQYPYYRVFCGHEPVVTASIMGKRYYTPDMEAYKKTSWPSAVYCTEEEAKKAGFQRSSAQ